MIERALIVTGLLLMLAVIVTATRTKRVIELIPSESNMEIIGDGAWLDKPKTARIRDLSEPTGM